VPALLYCWGAAQGATLEMLSQVAAAIWDALVPPEPPKPEPSPLVTIAPAAEPAPSSAWDALSPEDQAIHLRAQRFARAQVAQMRLNDGAAVQSGRTQRDLYAALHSRIDSARAAFHQKFFAQCPNMVDYIHVELVRSLAQDDADLLGKDYPGPLL